MVYCTRLEPGRGFAVPREFESHRLRHFGLAFCGGFFTRRCMKAWIFVCSTVLGWLASWAADAAGADMVGSFMVGGVGAIAGCFLGYWICKKFF